MYHIGIDLGGTNIAIGIVDEKFNIVRKGSTPTKAKREMDEIMDDMAALCAKLVKEAGLSIDDIESAGIAAPGSANPETGIISYANNLPMRNYHITAKLKERFPVKNAYLENDANAAALGEALAGDNKSSDYFLMLTLGTGVGGGIIIDKKIYSGFNHAGGELGHVVIEKDGRPCSCGRRGCFEAYSSATGLVNMTKEKMLERPDSLMWKECGGNIDNAGGRTAFNAMKAGDAAAKEVTDMYISYLACGVANMINIFQPEVLCIGGGVCNEGATLMDPVIEIVKKETYGIGAEKSTKICRASLGNDAGIIGAAALGMKL
jgi:glucokinase